MLSKFVGENWERLATMGALSALCHIGGTLSLHRFLTLQTFVWPTAQVCS